MALASTAADKGGHGWDDVTEDTIAVAQAYVAEASVGKVVQALLRTLLAAKDRLPYNPYPWLVEQLGLHATRHDLQRAQGDDTIIQQLSLLAAVEQRGEDGTQSRLTFADSRSGDRVWGLLNSVGLCDIHAVHVYSCLMKQGTRVVAQVPDDDASVSCAVLFGVASPVCPSSFHPHCAVVSVSQDYLLRGSDTRASLQYFALRMTEDVLRFGHYGHVLLSVRVGGGAGSSEQVWEQRQIRQKKTAFCEAITQASLKGLSITALAVFKVVEIVGDVEQPSYACGEKHYRPHFAPDSDGHDGKPTTIQIAGVPFEKLYEGVLLVEDQAREYFGLFEGAGSVQMAADDPAVYQAYRSRLRTQLGSLEMPRDIVTVAELILSLVVLECPDWSDSGLVPRAMRIFRSLAARVHKAIVLLGYVVQLFRVCVKHPKYLPVLKAQLSDLRGQCEELFAQDVAAPFRALAPTVDNSLAQAVVLLLDEPAETEAALKSVEASLTVVMHSACADAMRWSSALVEFHQECIDEVKSDPSSNLIQEAARVARRVVGRLINPNQQAGQAMLDKARRFGHGAETDPTHNLTIDVEASTHSSNAPEHIRAEAVLLQYVVDTRLEATISDALFDLMSSPRLNRNPYSFLAEECKKAMCQLELWGRSDKQIQRGLEDLTSRIQGTEVYTIPQFNVFGAQRALAGMDHESVQSMLQVLQPLINPALPYSKDNQTSVAAALVGDVVHYGSVSAHVCDVELEELYLIRGPHFVDGVELYAQGITDHVLEMSRASAKGIVLSSVQVGEQSWSIGLILTNPNDLRTELHTAVLNRLAISLKFHLLVDWRYVTVRKHTVCVLTGTDGKQHRQATRGTVSLSETVYFGREHAKRGMLANRLATTTTTQAGWLEQRRQSVAQACRHGRWVEACRRLVGLCKAREEAHLLPSLWRALHSTAEQIHYVGVLLETLGDIVQGLLEDPALAKAVDARACATMLAGARCKLETILRQPVALCPLRLVERTLAMLDSLWGPADAIAMSEEAVAVLAETQRVLAALECCDMPQILAVASDLRAALADCGRAEDVAMPDNRKGNTAKEEGEEKEAGADGGAVLGAQGPTGARSARPSQASRPRRSSLASASVA